MSGSSAQGIKPNLKLFLVDVKSFVDSAQLRSDISKGSKILVIFSLEGKFWAVGLALLRIGLLVDVALHGLVLFQMLMA